MPPAPRLAGRLVRSPNVVAYWSSGRFVLEEFERRRAISVRPLAAALLDRFGRAASPESVARRFAAYSSRSVLREIQRLARLGFLVEPDSPARRSRAREWEGLLPAAYLHAAARNGAYIVGLARQEAYLRRRLAERRPAPFFKAYPKAASVRLPPRPLEGLGVSLAAALDRRRTVRSFSRRPVGREALLRLVSAVFGTTGWIDGGVLGPLPAKRHPSGGSRHPLEAYPVVWNAAGVVPGLYHVDARGRRLELLRRGDFRLEAAAFGSGQSWIARAGFVVVLTAVFARTLWKYPSPNAYRLLLLEAGHAAQNFALLCAALGLGPFQTAALQEGRIEAFLGLDGFREFPVYLLGAGTPARPGRATSRTSPPPG